MMGWSGTSRGLVGWGVALLLLTGCTSVEERLDHARADYIRGDYLAADQQLVDLHEDDPGNALLYEMERGIVRMALGHPSDAESLLNRAAQRLDDFIEQSLASQFAALVSDDRSLEYGGEDYEKILVQAVLALASLGGNQRDSLAYANLIIQRQAELIQSQSKEYQEIGLTNPRSSDNYKLIAVGSYLVGIIEEANPLRSGRAQEAYRRVQALEPDSALAAEAVERASTRPHNGPGKGVLHVLTLTGRGPYKRAVQETATAQALEIARILWSAYRGEVTFPILAPLEVSELAFHPGNPTAVEVQIDGQRAGTTSTVTDVEETARRQFAALRDHMLARAVIRRVFKLGVIEGAKAAVSERGKTQHGRRHHTDKSILAQVFIQIFGWIWIGVEQADLRHWGLLPARFQAFRTELAPGEYTIDLFPLREGFATTAQPQRVRVLIRENEPTFVVALTPTAAGGPPPLTSDPGSELAPEAEHEPVPTSETANR